MIGSNRINALGSRLRGHKCEIYINNMRVNLRLKISEFDFCAPNVVNVKGEPKFDGNALDVPLNPTVALEILSRKKRYYDEIEKLDSYLQMDSIKVCLWINEEEMRFEHHSKQNSKQKLYIGFISDLTK